MRSRTILASNERVIDQLRRILPGDWSYDARANEWTRADGVKVRAYAQLVDEDEYATEYRRTDSHEHEHVPVLPRRRR